MKGYQTFITSPLTGTFKSAVNQELIRNPHLHESCNKNFMEQVLSNSVLHCESLCQQVIEDNCSFVKTLNGARVNRGICIPQTQRIPLRKPVKTIHRYNTLGPGAVALCKGEQHKGSCSKHASVECGVYMKAGARVVYLQPDITLSVKSLTPENRTV